MQNQDPEVSFGLAVEETCLVFAYLPKDADLKEDLKLVAKTKIKMLEPKLFPDIEPDLVERLVPHLRYLIGRRLEEVATQKEFQEVKDCLSASSTSPFLSIAYKSVKDGTLKQILPVELLAIALDTFRKELTSEYALNFKFCVTSVPPYFNDSQRQQMKDLITLCGMTCLRIINDATAASLRFALNKRTETNVVNGFHLGKHGCHFSDLMIEDGIFEIRICDVLTKGTAAAKKKLTKLIAGYVLQVSKGGTCADESMIESHVNERFTTGAWKEATFPVTGGTGGSVSIKPSKLEELELANEALFSLEDLSELFKKNKSYFKQDEVTRVIVFGNTEFAESTVELIRKVYENVEILMDENPLITAAIGCSDQAKILRP